MANLHGTEKPTLRIIRSLARSGGTLVTKCLGCMDDVALISEVHPGDPKSKIRTQAHEWFDLIDSKTVRWWKIRRPSMLKIVSTIDEKLLDQFLAKKDYLRACALLGYSP